MYYYAYFYSLHHMEGAYLGVRIVRIVRKSNSTILKPIETGC